MKDDDGTTEASAARKQPEKQIEESVESSKVSEIKNPAEQASISHSDLNKVLLGKALGPFYPRLIKWAEGLSWKKSVLVLIALTSVTELARNVWGDPTELKDFFLLVSYYRDAQHSVASQYSSDRAEATSILSQCATDQFAPLLKGYPGGMYDAWTEAQLRVALDGIATVDDPELLLWFQGQMSGGRCWCWRQHPSSEVGHIGATAWVLLAFSRMKQQPGESQIAFLLTNQHAAGWWPQYPSLDVEDNASTYATAPSVWALHELLRRDLIVKRQKIGVETAILLGRDWLV